MVSAALYTDKHKRLGAANLSCMCHFKTHPMVQIGEQNMER